MRVSMRAALLAVLAAAVAGKFARHGARLLPGACAAPSRVARLRARVLASGPPDSAYHVSVPHLRRDGGDGASADEHPALGPVVRSARDAIEQCTGVGTESSGTGRVEWGTWLEDELRDAVASSLNEVHVRAGEASWAQLLDGAEELEEARTLRVSGDAEGKRWDVRVHLLPAPLPPPASGGADGGEAAEAAAAAAAAARRSRVALTSPPTGTITLLKPLVGTAQITKLRLTRDGDFAPVGAPLEAAGTGFGGVSGAPTAANATLLLGGLTQEYSGALGRAALLEVVLRPPATLAAEDLPPLEPYAPLPLERAPLAAAFQRVQDASLYEGEGAEESARRVAALGARRAEPGGGADGGARSPLSQNVGGLEAQLDAIVRRVLASRANPAAARQLGISHVRGILLSGPPGCGKTLLARELARLLGAREPQVVNGPECLSKFVGEAEANIRKLFAPAEAEYAAAGDASALHVIILDEMDAIARARGSVSGDSSGVRDSVVNQLLAKMDGVVEAPNVLVVGLTNRPELLDEALLRPGRLEVQLRVALPDAAGRRDILRIHTRAMRDNGVLDEGAAELIDDAGAAGALAQRTEHFSGAELAGLVRSAASFALERAMGAAAEPGGAPSAAAPLDEAAADAAAAEADADGLGGVRVRASDFELALREITPALGKRDDELRARFALHGAAPPSAAHARLQRSLRLFVGGAAAAAEEGGAAPPRADGGAPPARVRSLLLAAEGEGAGVTALGAWAAALASAEGVVDYARVLTPADALAGAEGEGARCAALAAAFGEARAMRRAALLLDDVDRLLAGSEAVAATLRALLREPLGARAPQHTGAAEPAAPGGGGGGTVDADAPGGRAAAELLPPALIVIGTTSDPRAPSCALLRGAFDETQRVPLLRTADEARALLARAALPIDAAALEPMAAAALGAGPVGAKRLLQLAERACALARLEEAEGAAHAPEQGAGGGARPEGAAPPSGLAARQAAAMRACVEDWAAVRADRPAAG